VGVYILDKVGIHLVKIFFKVSNTKRWSLGGKSHFFENENFPSLSLLYIALLYIALDSPKCKITILFFNLTDFVNHGKILGRHLEVVLA